MFETISWQEFLTVITGAVIFYYAISILLLFSSEIINIFKQKQSKQITPETKEDQNDSSESNELMGKVKYESETSPTREKSISSEELQIQSTDVTEEVIEVSSVKPSDAILLGTIADFLQEIKTLTEVVKDSSKEEATALFKSLISRYQQVGDTHYKDALNIFIYDSCEQHCAFNLELKEIIVWWPEAEKMSIHNQ